MMRIRSYLNKRVKPAMRRMSPVEKFNYLAHKQEEVEQLKNAVDNMKMEVAKEMVRTWYKELKQNPEYPVVQKSSDSYTSFGTYIHGLFFYCSVSATSWNSNYQPKWGISYNLSWGEKPTPEQVHIVNSIIEELQVEPDEFNGYPCLSRNTRNGAERWKAMFDAAKKLGFTD